MAEDAPDNRVSRLGFKFDQQAHDAAVAAENSRQPADEPLPAGVIRLPHLQVTARAMPAQKEMLTPKGRIEVAKRRYETPLYQAVVGPLEGLASLLNNPLGGWNPNAPEALALYEDDEQKRRNHEMSDLLDLAAFADRAQRPAEKTKSTSAAGK
ncbi:MAG TPA: hypothetical protein VHE13_01890 [Opitutus sp.]|nr:hypothetical protein [Opitutus sp.]